MSRFTRVKIRRENARSLYDADKGSCSEIKEVKNRFKCDFGTDIRRLTQINILCLLYVVFMSVGLSSG